MKSGWAQNDQHSRNIYVALSCPPSNFVLSQSENFLGLERNDYFMPRPPSILVGSDLCYVPDISIKVLMK